MKVVLGIATCVWLSIIMMVIPSLAIRDAVFQEEQRQQLGVIETATFDFEDGVTGYTTFLTTLRSKFAGPLTACSLPVTRSELPIGGEYVLAQLKISSTQWVTVALRVTDMYLVAYRVNKLYSGKYKAIFLNEPDVAKAKAILFQDATPSILPYDSNYQNIERQAGPKGSREYILLGFFELKKRIEAFYDEDKDVTPAEEARFFLVAIQMVAEATRYSYIEDKVKAKEYGHFKPDAKMLDLEKDWQKTSKFVRKADADGTCGSDTVVDIKADTKLLLRENNRSSSANVFSHQLWSQIAETSLIDE